MSIDYKALAASMTADELDAWIDANTPQELIDAEVSAMRAEGQLVRNGSSMGGSVRTRYATPGQRSGRGTVRKLSDRQVAFIRHLMRERDTRGLVRLPGSEDFENMSLRGARDLIERLLACPVRADAVPADAPMATPAQVSYLTTLMSQRVVPDGMAFGEPATMTRKAASDAIEALKAAPYRPRETATPTELDAAIYLLDGRVYKVQRAVHGSGNMYAKVLNPESGKFEYASGAIRNLKPDMRMSLDQAKEYGALYGVCARCGRTLTDEASIERAIGPVCAGKF